MTMPLPADAVAAVCHPDPYPFYAGLVGRGLAPDPRLGLWIAASAAAATAVLDCDAARVRPPAEPVPVGLRGTSVGDLFGRLVRMTDGPDQRRMKGVIAAALAAVDRAAVTPAFDIAIAARLAPAPVRLDGRMLDGVVADLPAFAVAALLGVPAARLADAAPLVAAFVRAIGPGAAAEAVLAGTAAIERLRALLAAVADAGILGRLQADAAAAGCDPAAVAANVLGLLSQSFEATAALIGNALLAVVREPAARALAGDPARLDDVVAEVLRHDPPVQNTRRYLADDAVLDGRAVPAGAAILVVLAAAGRDPAMHPDPDRFDPDRRRRLYTFGLGRHACPGDRIAAWIAAAALPPLLARCPGLADLAAAVRYRPSPNIRCPQFG